MGRVGPSPSHSLAAPAPLLTRERHHQRHGIIIALLRFTAGRSVGPVAVLTIECAPQHEGALGRRRAGCACAVAAPARSSALFGRLRHSLSVPRSGDAIRAGREGGSAAVCVAEAAWRAAGQDGRDEGNRCGTNFRRVQTRIYLHACGFEREREAGAGGGGGDGKLLWHRVAFCRSVRERTVTAAAAASALTNFQLERTGLARGGQKRADLLARPLPHSDGYPKRGRGSGRPPNGQWMLVLVVFPLLRLCLCPSRLFVAQ